MQINATNIITLTDSTISSVESEYRIQPITEDHLSELARMERRVYDALENKDYIAKMGYTGIKTAMKTGYPMGAFDQTGQAVGMGVIERIAGQQRLTEFAENHKELMACDFMDKNTALYNIHGIRIDPDHQGRKLGKHLLAARLQLAKYLVNRYQDHTALAVSYSSLFNVASWANLANAGFLSYRITTDSMDDTVICMARPLTDDLIPPKNENVTNDDYWRPNGGQLPGHLSRQQAENLISKMRDNCYTVTGVDKQKGVRLSSHHLPWMSNGRPRFDLNT
jgi:GNAT superfamily N-acetyltransferase